MVCSLKLNTITVACPMFIRECVTVQVEDVFITGIIAQKAGVRRVNLPHMYQSSARVRSLAQMFFQAVCDLKIRGAYKMTF